VIVSVEQNEPKVFIPGDDALPFGPFDPVNHATLEQGLRSFVAEQTPVNPGYVEQLYTFGNKDRYATKERVLSIGYLALTRGGGGHWGAWYEYFPWEDWRSGKPAMIDKIILPALKKWAGSTPERVARVRACFEDWDEEKALDRYELLYWAALIPEALRDKKLDGKPVPGKPMLYDHRRILATAIQRLRGKLKYRPVVFELMPETFTLLQLQRTVEAIMGHTLHKQNFRRFVEASGMVEEVKGKKSAAAGGRPAALFRFRA